MTTIVPEYHTTMQYENDTYYMRPFIMSDKDFFLETWADFPTEAVNPNPERLFEKRINMFLSYIDYPSKGYLPAPEGYSVHPSHIFSKNGSPFGIDYSDVIWEDGEMIVKNKTVAIHPSFRGQGLRTKMEAFGKFWAYSSEAKLPIKRVEYEVGHSDTSSLQWQKDKEQATFLESRPGNTFGASNNSISFHKFYTTQNKHYNDDAPGATFEISLHEYNLTDDRYKTEYVTSGEFDLNRNTIEWDKDL